MELMLHILMYLGFLAPGNYTLTQFNTILMTNQAQINLVQNNQVLSQQAGQTSIVGVLVVDDKEN